MRPHGFGQGTDLRVLDWPAELAPARNREQRHQEPVLGDLFRDRKRVEILLSIPDTERQVSALIRYPHVEIEFFTRQRERCSQPFQPLSVVPVAPVEGEVVAVPRLRQPAPVLIEGGLRELRRALRTQLPHRLGNPRLVADPPLPSARTQTELELREQIRGRAILEEARRQSCTPFFQFHKSARFSFIAGCRQCLRRPAQKFADPTQANRWIEASQPSQQLGQQTCGGVRGLLLPGDIVVPYRFGRLQDGPGQPALVHLPDRAQGVHDGQRHGGLNRAVRDPFDDPGQLAWRCPRDHSAGRLRLHRRRFQPFDEQRGAFRRQINRQIDQVGHRGVQPLVHEFETLFLKARERAHHPVTQCGRSKASVVRSFPFPSRVTPHRRVGHQAVQRFDRCLDKRVTLARRPAPTNHASRKIEPDGGDRPDRILGTPWADALKHQFGSQRRAIRIQPSRVRPRVEPASDGPDGAILVCRRYVQPDHGLDVLESRSSGSGRRAGAEDPPDRRPNFGRQRGFGPGRASHYEISRTKMSDAGASISIAQSCCASARYTP